MILNLEIYMMARDDLSSNVFDLQLRFGVIDKYLSNTNVFEHAKKYYSIAENHMPQEIDIHSLETLENWNVISGSWTRPFTSHPKVYIDAKTKTYISHLYNKIQ